MQVFLLHTIAQQLISSTVFECAWIYDVPEVVDFVKTASKLTGYIEVCSGRPLFIAV
jgi:hypothetical protein